MDTGVAPGPMRPDGEISDGAEIVARAHALRPLIEAAGPATEAARELAPEVVAALHDAGLFRMLLPRELDGAELPLPRFVEAVEALAMADGSVAWCVGQGSGCSIAAAHLAPEAARAVFGAPRAVLAWGPGVGGRALAAPGGWRLSGRWGYNSGSRHADWLGGIATLHDADGAPRLLDGGAPQVRSFLFPKSQARVIDDWQVSGLRGTGSDTSVVEDLFVPEAFSFLRTAPAPHPALLYRAPLMEVYPMAFGAVALGLARAMLDAFTAMAGGKTPRGMSKPMRDSAAIQSLLGHGETRLRAARCFLRATVAELWADLRAGRPHAEAHSLAIRMASTFAIHEAVAVADMAWHEAGATVIHASQPFERRWRDLHAVAQQVQARRANFELVGQRLLGMETGPLFV